MGAGQSTGGGTDAPLEVKTSFYEVLGIERQASDDEIKRAYKRKALELHPDRNYGNDTTGLFAEVQAAFEVLSDPHERAWYDAHEAEILRGGEPEGGAGEHFEANIKVTTVDDITKMMKKFNRGIDFSDMPTGFYGFLRDTFAQLAKEEEAAARWEGSEEMDYPPFGHEDDTYDPVVKEFYGVWSGFATRKTFAWKDKWRLSDAPDRRIRRLMEKDNQKLREQGIKQFNEAVRMLVTFVKKRDPRWTPPTTTDAERQKSLRDAAAAQAAKARAENEAKMRAENAIPDWAKARDPDELEEMEEEEEEQEEFECVACHKTFKSERQFEAHEKSKKHQKAVQALKRKMQKDNKNLHLDEISSSGAITPMSDEEELEDNKDTSGKAQGRDIDDLADDVETIYVNGASESEDVLQGEDEAKKTQMQADGSQETSDESEASDDDYAPRSKITNRLKQNAPERAASAKSDEDEDVKSVLEDSDAAPTKAAPKKGKAAQKRAKRAAQAAADDQTELKFKCAVCDEAFPSKTRMFQHIKDWGHAAPPSSVGGKGKKGKK
ncbi:DnaJ-domain-containing protein [Rhizodiscina lignyota]|uniref:DnaJ-domain-containing protein n=1 Tax=Rhizodiscina lignyota TaxID=1504668 RepID=A0A9P4I728_9PEZI|nr:DnaJ-domain-containing protein [Rhizodiscina lignyota]